jgi:UDP-GlcNAc3NAcA epimerase
MKVASIIGARPQFIKAAPISRAMIQVEGATSAGPERMSEILVHTGQHYDDNMSEVFFRELGIPAPDYNLGVGAGTHGWQTGQMLIGIEDVLLKEKPDWVLVYGDTNSTVAGALAAAKLHIPLAHVEAGLRSFNRRMPEEINRVVADHLSSLLFCPSQVAVENLAGEGISRRVYLVGDVMADSLAFAARASNHSQILQQLGLVERGFLLATVHRAENTENEENVCNILHAFDRLKEKIVFPAHPRTLDKMKKLGISPAAHVKLIEPLGYLDMVMLIRSARMILTDSGGLQKEAYWLSVPCVTLRKETEWVETVELGWNVLTGPDVIRITKAVQTLNPPRQHPPLYGDGKTAERICKLLSGGRND